MPQEIPPPRMFDDPDRLRVCSLSGITGTVLVLVAFFLPWAEVDPGVAASFRQRVDDSRIASSAPSSMDWDRIATHLTDDSQVTGLDVFYWARTAFATASSDTLSKKDESGRLATRGIRVAAIWLAAIPLAAFVLLIYFLLHHCRRSRSPALILATLTGAAAMTTAAVYHITSGALEGYITSASPGATAASGISIAMGMKLLPIGGAVLFLAGTFGVRFANWWRVFSGALILGAILAAWILLYVKGQPLLLGR